jgi:hypothetical protein
LRKYFCRSENARSPPLRQPDSAPQSNAGGAEARPPLFAAMEFGLDCAALRFLIRPAAQSGMMIDIFNHFMPKAYLDRLGTLIPGQPALTSRPFGTSTPAAR